MKVKDLINILDEYKDYEIGLWDDESFLDVNFIEEYPNKIIAIGGIYLDELNCDSFRTINNIYDKDK